MTAADVQRLKELLPTNLGSGEIRESIAADILRRSVFSARMECARHLARLRDTLAALSAGEINEADARARLLASLAEMGHSPLDGGGIANPASVRRLELVLATNRQMAASVAKLAEETPATLARWPAWRLTRMEGRGALVRPVHADRLTVPACAVSYGRRAAEVKALGWRLFRGRGKGEHILYWLRDEVTLPVDRGLLPSDRAVSETVDLAFAGEIMRVARKVCGLA